MKIDKNQIQTILVVSLSNIGDVILTLPVLDALRNEFPSAELSVLVGPKAKGLLESNPDIHKVWIYDKHQPILDTLSMIFSMFKQRLDLVVDLRNTVIPIVVFPRYKTGMHRKQGDKVHMRKKHLNVLRHMFTSLPERSVPRNSLVVSESDQKHVRTMCDDVIGREKGFVVLTASAADKNKRWPDEHFAALSDQLLNEFGLISVFIGDDKDIKLVDRMLRFMENKAINLAGQLTLIQLVELYRHARLAIGNDSGPMHIASYVNVPAITIFGPTDPICYGPWSEHSQYVRANSECSKCANPKSQAYHSCMFDVSPKQVLTVVGTVLQAINEQNAKN